MLKRFYIGVLLVALVAAGKIGPGKVIGPIVEKSENDLPLFGSFLTNKYAKIAREIIHNSSECVIINFSSQ